MLVNLKRKTILPLTMACLMVASGLHAVDPLDEADLKDKAGSVKRDFPLEEASQKSIEDQGDHRYKRRRLEASDEILDPWTLSEQQRNVLVHILSYLSPNDLLSLRLTDNRISMIATDLWKQKVSQANPRVNFSQVWADGPESGSFQNFALNLVIHRIQVELGAFRLIVFTFRPPQHVKMLENMTKLRDIKGHYSALTTIFDCFDSVAVRLFARESIETFLREDRVSRLTHSGNAEKRLVQFFYFLNGNSLVIDSIQSPGEPKPFVKLISDELALRKRIGRTPEAQRLPLYEELLVNGVYIRAEAFRDAGLACFRAQQYEQAARHFEAVLIRQDTTTQDFRTAAAARFRAQQYEQSVHHYEAVLERPDAITQDFRNAGLVCLRAQQYEQAVRHWDDVLNRSDATAQDQINAAEANAALANKYKSADDKDDDEKAAQYKKSF